MHFNCRDFCRVFGTNNYMEPISKMPKGNKEQVILISDSGHRKIFFKILFIHETHTQRGRERQRHRQREKQAPCREPDVGYDPGSPGSRPGPKAGAKLLLPYQLS